MKSGRVRAASEHRPRVGRTRGREIQAGEMRSRFELIVASDAMDVLEAIEVSAKGRADE